jgi:hypothetical protein
VVAQPARKKISAQEMIPAVLNTRQLCGTEMRTQAVSFICDGRFTIDAPYTVRA